jgi:hypothetical protein
MSVIDDLRIPYGDCIGPARPIFTGGLFIAGDAGAGKSQISLQILDALIKQQINGLAFNICTVGSRGDFDELIDYRTRGTDVKTYSPDFLDMFGYGLDLEADIVTPLDIKKLANYLKAVLQNSSEFFDKGAGLLIHRLIHRLYRLAKTHGVEFSLRVICLIARDPKYLRRFLKSDPQVKRAFSAHLGDNRLGRDFFATVSQSIDDFVEIAAGFDCAEDGISIRRFYASSERSILKVPMRVEKADVYQPLFNSFLRGLFEWGLARRGRNPKPTIYIIDEFAYVAHLLTPQLRNLFARLRTYGRANNIAIIGNCQTEGQLVEELTEPGFRGIFDAFQNTIFHSARGTTARQFSDHVGQITYERKQDWLFYDEPKYELVTEPIIPPQKFQALPLADPDADKIEAYISVKDVGVWHSKSRFMKLARELDGARDNKIIKEPTDRTFEDLELKPFEKHEIEALGLKKKPKKLKLNGATPPKFSNLSKKGKKTP